MFQNCCPVLPNWLFPKAGQKYILGYNFPSISPGPCNWSRGPRKIAFVFDHFCSVLPLSFLSAFIIANVARTDALLIKNTKKMVVLFFVLYSPLLSDTCNRCSHVTLALLLIQGPADFNELLSVRKKIIRILMITIVFDIFVKLSSWFQKHFICKMVYLLHLFSRKNGKLLVHQH